MDQSTDLSFNFWQFLLAPPNSHWQLELYLPTTDHQGELEWMPLVESKNHLRNIPSCKKQNKNNHPLIATCFFHQLLETLKKKNGAPEVYFLNAGTVWVFVLDVYMNYVWLDETESRRWNIPNFSRAFPYFLPHAHGKMLRMFFRGSGQKIISNKSFGIILDEFLPSPEIIRVIFWEVSHHQKTQIYWNIPSFFLSHSENVWSFTAAKCPSKIGSCKPQMFTNICCSSDPNNARKGVGNPKESFDSPFILII